jgi:putative hydrolase of the HAD superfamily
VKKSIPISCLFLDIGGVLLTNGWDRRGRVRAAEEFDLDLNELEDRHRLMFDTYETGKLTLQEYLNCLVFYRKRPFSPAAFRDFMFAQSRPFPRMIDLIRCLKEQHNLKIAVVSNEGRELNQYRIRKFRLHSFVDCFISSNFVHLRKPDPDIYRMALDMTQVPVGSVFYIEDRPLFVQVAETLGIRGIQHMNYRATRSRLAELGLKAAEAYHNARSIIHTS